MKWQGNQYLHMNIEKWPLEKGQFGIHFHVIIQDMVLDISSAYGHNVFVTLISATPDCYKLK